MLCAKAYLTAALSSNILFVHTHTRTHTHTHIYIYIYIYIYISFIIYQYIQYISNIIFIVSAYVIKWYMFHPLQSFIECYAPVNTIAQIHLAKYRHMINGLVHALKSINNILCKANLATK